MRAGAKSVVAFGAPVLRSLSAASRSVMRRKASFLADQRGAVALEVPAVWLFLMLIVLLPLADITVAGFKFISARQALRNFGQSILYSPPPDVTNASSWSSAALAKADTRYPIPSIQLICGESNSVCSSANSDPTQPKYFVYTTTVTLSPIVLKSLLCTGGTTSGCKFTLSYTERFQ
ncbi:Flp pilus assembly protein TadG [Bradyrhizobium huanghuaihaiense]